jgi:DNA polymerase-4
MNKIHDDDRIRWLFLDLNSYYASCEQQERSELRGRPIAIVQTMSDYTCAIAASYEAKAFGVKTGTIIKEAKIKCPDLVIVKARHPLYLSYHKRILEAVESCLPITKVCSIDEMACRLTGRDQIQEYATRLSYQIKQTIAQRVGSMMTCSIGLGPNLFLGKVGSDMQKPNGLVTIRQKDLPDILYPLKLNDIYGIGQKMEQRLHQAGIFSVRDLMRASRYHLRSVWGGIQGVLYYELLRGADLQFPSSSIKHSLSHEHILEPELRTLSGALAFSQYLLSKGAERLRRQNYYCRSLGLYIRSLAQGERFWKEVTFQESQETDFLLDRLSYLWKAVPHLKPLKVGIFLGGLVPESQHQPDLFENYSPQYKLSSIVDRINQRFGRGTISFGKQIEAITRFTGHAAFQRIPEEWEF